MNPAHNAVQAEYVRLDGVGQSPRPLKSPGKVMFAKAMPRFTMTALDHRSVTGHSVCARGS
jgi:hypothetical protein